MVPGRIVAQKGMLVLCNEVTLVICLLNLLTCHVFDLPTLRTLRPGSRRGPISNVFHEDHEVTGVSFMVDMLEVNVSPTHVLLCGKRFTHMITLWLFVPLIVGSACTCLPPLVVKVRGCTLVPHGQPVVLTGFLRYLARPPHPCCCCHT